MSRRLPKWVRDRFKDPVWLAEEVDQRRATGVAQELGVDPETVRRACRRHGIELRQGKIPTPLSAAALRRCEQLLKEDYSLAEIAEKLEMPRSTLRVKLLKAGVLD